MTFHVLPPPTDEEVVAICTKVARRVTRLLKRRGYLDGEDNEEPDVMGLLQSKAVQATLALRRTRGEEGPPAKRRCASVEGFSVHANVDVHANDRQGLEKLARYMGRNSIALDRLDRHPNGGIIYRFKHPMADGSTGLELAPMEFLGRVIALVPPPRAHLTRYSGAFAPNARLRSKVVLVPKAKQRAGGAKNPAHRRAGKLDWASLLKRVFAIDILKCSACGGPMKVLAYITDRAVVKKILSHLGLPAEPPPRGRVPTSQAVLELSPLAEREVDEAIDVEERIAWMRPAVPALPSPEIGGAELERAFEADPRWEEEPDLRPAFSEADYAPDPKLAHLDPEPEVSRDDSGPAVLAAVAAPSMALNSNSRPRAGGRTIAGAGSSRWGGGPLSLGIEVVGPKEKAGRVGDAEPAVPELPRVEVRGEEGERAEAMARWRVAPRESQAPPGGEGSQASSELADEVPGGNRVQGDEGNSDG